MTWTGFSDITVFFAFSSLWLLLCPRFHTYVGYFIRQIFSTCTRNIFCRISLYLSHYWGASPARSMWMRPFSTHVARSVVSVCLCWAHWWAVQKTAEASEMPFVGAGSCGPKEMYQMASHKVTGRNTWGRHLTSLCSIGTMQRWVWWRCGPFPNYFGHLS